MEAENKNKKTTGRIPHEQPLSTRLLNVLDLDNVDSDHITIGHFINQTGEDSIPLLQMLVSLPFCFPIPIPSWGLIAGSIVIYTGYFQLTRKPLDLPGKIENTKIPKKNFQKVLRVANRLIAFLEKWITPRHTRYFEPLMLHRFHALLMIFVGLLLWFPWPAILILNNFFPAIAIIALSLSLMEHDGRAIWVAYLLSILSVIYTILLIYLGEKITATLMNLIR